MRGWKIMQGNGGAGSRWTPLGAAIFAFVLISLALRSATGAAQRAGATPTTPIIWTDVDGHGYGPLHLRAAPATVFIFFSTQCPIANQYMPRLRALDDAYTPRGIRFFLVDSHALDSGEQARQFVRERKVFVPIVKDIGTLLADRLGATLTPEAVAVSREGTIVYRGR